MKSSTSLGAFTIAVALFVASLAVPRAQQAAQQPPAAQPPAQQQPAQQGQRGGQGERGGAPQGAPPAATQAKPFVPVAASTLAKNPQAYYGEMITVTAAVEQTLSKTAFSVDQDKTKSTGQEVLVLAPTMNGTVDLNSYVTVIGEAMPFDAAEVAKKAKGYNLDLTPEMAAKYKGKPVVIATAVVNSAGIDVAKKPIPPPTADDLALAKLMKQVGPANGALRGDIDKMDLAATKEHAVLLKQMFTQTEAFWKSKARPEPTQLAAAALKDAEALETAVNAGNWDQARTAAGSLGQKCGQCHTPYRERMDDGTFRIKSGG
jgi:cytochrome c556